MASLVSSVGSYVEAGVRGLRELAEGYMAEPDGDGDVLGEKEDTKEQGRSATPPPTTQHLCSTSSESAELSSSSNSSLRSTKPSQKELVKAVGVTSGWIHLQSTYLDSDSGERTIRSFGLQNMVDDEVIVDVQSDLEDELVFWSSLDTCGSRIQVFGFCD